MYFGGKKALNIPVETCERFCIYSLRFVQWVASLLPIMAFHLDVLSSTVLLKACAQREFFLERGGKSFCYR